MANVVADMEVDKVADILHKVKQARGAQSRPRSGVRWSKVGVSRVEGLGSA